MGGAYVGRLYLHHAAVVEERVVALTHHQDHHVPGDPGVLLESGAGTTRNLPLPVGTSDGEWLGAVDELVAWVTGAGCTALVVPLGVDAAKDDPESPLQVTHDGYRQAGVLIGSSGLPAVVVQEGGYRLPTLGWAGSGVPLRSRLPGPGLGHLGVGGGAPASASRSLSARWCAGSGSRQATRPPTRSRAESTDSDGMNEPEGDRVSDIT